jgi:SHS2 domain-containing protein
VRENGFISPFTFAARLPVYTVLHLICLGTEVAEHTDDARRTVDARRVAKRVVLIVNMVVVVVGQRNEECRRILLKMDDIEALIYLWVGLDVYHEAAQHVFWRR